MATLNDRLKQFGNWATEPPKKSLNGKIDSLIKNRPKYQIQDEAFQNQALAKNQAFGRDLFHIQIFKRKMS